MTAVKSVAKVEKVEAPQTLPAVTPMEMLDRAIQSGAGLEVIEKFMALQERWEANQGRKAFDAAMSAAKAEIGPIIKNRRVNFEARNGGKKTDYRYEDLAQIAEQINPALSENGLSYRYQTQQNNGSVTVTCVISHCDGYSERNSLTAGVDNSGNKNAIQAIGSTVTFLQRYTLKAALGLAVSNDDDGKGTEDQPQNLTEEQIKALRTKIEEVGADASRCCEIWKVEAISDLPQKRFEWAMNQLTQFGRRNNA